MRDLSIAQKNHSIEGLRLIAALGIVWFHMQAPGQEIAYAALAVFLILTADLSSGSLQRSGTRVYLRNRVTRILFPWSVWSGLYLALAYARGVPISVHLADWRHILIGPEIHMWFLPFVFLASGFVLAAKRLVQTPRGFTLWLLLAIGFSTVSYLIHNWLSPPDPFAQWTFAIPPFLLGLIMAHARDRKLVWPEVLFIISVSGLTWAAGATEGVLQLLIAWPILRLFWSIPVPWDWLTKLGALSFGIYLIHPFFMLVMFKFAPALEATVPGVMLVFAASAAAVAILQRLPVFKRLV